SVPLKINGLAADSRSGFGICELQVGFEQVCRIDEDGLVGDDVVLRGADTAEAGRCEYVAVGVEDADSDCFVLFRRDVRDHVVAIFVSLRGVDLSATPAEKAAKRFAQ